MAAGGVMLSAVIGAPDRVYHREGNSSGPRAASEKWTTRQPLACRLLPSVVRTARPEYPFRTPR
jgi:hypothetical protein